MCKEKREFFEIFLKFILKRHRVFLCTDIWSVSKVMNIYSSNFSPHFREKNIIYKNMSEITEEYEEVEEIKEKTQIKLEEEGLGFDYVFKRIF